MPEPVFKSKISTAYRGITYAEYLLQKNLDQYVCDAVWLLKKLIEIPSFSKEEQRAADFLQKYIIELGFKPERKGNNLRVTDVRDSNLPTVLFNSHIDTVKPTSTWNSDPFTPVVDSGRLTGLGSNDAGASVVSQLMAYRILSLLPERNFNLIYSATCEEESSSDGGIESILSEIWPVDLAIVGEPTQMQMAIAEKGLMVLEATVRGVTGHAARNEGINALYLALDDIHKIRNLSFGKSSDLLGNVKLSVTAINCGTQHNVVPDLCKYLIDVRSNEHYNHHEIIETILEKTSHTELNVLLSNQKTSILPTNHPIVKRATDLGLTYFGSSTTSDQMVIPFPSIKIGPGDSARSHTADEYIYIEEIKQGIETYIHLLDELTL